MVIGIDEAGRGPWAGPLTVCAVGLAPVNQGKLSELSDSKSISAQKRAALALQIKSIANYIELAWIDSRTIDAIGLNSAMELAVTKILIKAKNHDITKIIIDGSINFARKHQNTRAVIKADATVKSVSAASIIAKVARDSYMKQIAKQFPGYAFEKHKGYGTQAHREAIQRLGVSPLHRVSFQPVREFLL